MAADPECAHCHGTGVIESENWHEVEYHDCPTCATPEPQTVTITLPIVPDRRLAPNRAGGKSRWTLGKLIMESRAAAFNAAYAQAGSRWDAPNDHVRFDGPVTVEVTIYWGKSLKAGQKRARIEQDRRLDWDSAVAIIKPVCDGALVDMGYVADDRQILGGPVWQDVDKEGRGYMTITLREARP